MAGTSSASRGRSASTASPTRYGGAPSNAGRVAAINGGRHVAPTFAGDTIYAWTEVLEKHELPGRHDIGALRLRTIAVKDRTCADFPNVGADGKTDPSVVLDLDYTVLVPRRVG